MQAHFLTQRRKQKQVDWGQRDTILQKECRRQRIAEVRVLMHMTT